jgi:S1-C subfamily serine protease
MPNAVGLALSKTDKALVTSVAAGSVAQRAGFRAGDELLKLEGQPLVSIADVQWVLHNAPEPSEVKAEVLRDGKTVSLNLPLAKGWRRNIDFSWRPTTWAFRGMIGGLLTGDLTDDERSKANLGTDKLALLVKFVGQYGDHAKAKQAGFLKGDIIVGVDDKTDRWGESDWLEYLLRQRPSGEKVRVAVLRAGQRIDLELPIQ